jgi:hypothetical protein
MAPEPPGPRVFSRAIRSTPLPSPFRPPTSIAKYNGETKPELWLAYFRLACQLGGARGDNRAIIRQLLLFFSDTARKWLEELPADQIQAFGTMTKKHRKSTHFTFNHLGLSAYEESEARNNQ